MKIFIYLFVYWSNCKIICAFYVFIEEHTFSSSSIPMPEKLPSCFWGTVIYSL